MGISVSFLYGLTYQFGRSRMPSHRHGDVEIVHHPRGRGISRTAEGGSFAFAPGDTFLYPPFLQHSRTGTEPGTACCVHLRVPDPLPEALRHAVLIRGPLPEWLQQEIIELAGPHAVAGPRDREILDHRAAAILLTLLGRAAATGADDRDPEAIFADQAAQWIAEHFASIGRLELVAKALDTSYNRLRRAFRRHRGISLVDWLTEVRIARAKELLSGSALSHEEIARQCGYGSNRYLNQVFRRVTGMAPGAWRRRH